jgi:hypothetical protein
VSVPAHERAAVIVGAGVVAPFVAPPAALAPSPSAACAVTACGSARLLGISIRRRRSISRLQRYPNVKQGIICEVLALAIILNEKLGSYDDVVGYEVAASVAKGEQFLSLHRRYLGLNGVPRHRSLFINKIILCPV